MYKSVLSSTLPLVITVILFFVVGNYGIGRVQGLREQISQANIDKATLTQKLNTLQTVSAIVGTSSSTSASALPEKNPALITLSQLKSIAEQNTVVLSNLKSGGEAKDASGLSRVDLSFDVTGDTRGIIAFLDGVQKTAPISLVDKIKFNQEAGSGHANVTIKSFWAAFPKTIPSVTQQISDLTADEKNILSLVSALAQPQFAELPAGTTGGKTDPFAP